MSSHTLLLVGSPRNEKGTTHLIATNLEKKLTALHASVSKCYVSKLVKDEKVLLQAFTSCDTLVFIVPVYENNVPSTVLELFEMLDAHKALLENKQRKMFVISCTGYATMDASIATHTTCKLFAQSMHFSWLGSMNVAPSPLIEGENLGKMFSKLNTSLGLLADSLAVSSPLPNEVFLLNKKSVLPAWLYRFVGKMYFGKTVKTIGKANFYAKPLI